MCDCRAGDFTAALERRDTVARASMVVDASEFITLYYPSSSYAQPPYRQNPAFVWFQFQENGRNGMARALGRFGSILEHQGRCKFVSFANDL